MLKPEEVRRRLKIIRVRMDAQMRKSGNEINRVRKQCPHKETCDAARWFVTGGRTACADCGEILEQ